jgi:ribonuclease E
MHAPSAEGQQASLGFASADSSSASTPAEGGSAQAETENGESREKRSRDRYGRERGHRRERTEQDGERNEAAPVAADVVTSVPAPSAPAPVAAAPQASATHAVAEKAMPKVSSYALPTETLQQVAQTSGLQWVNSDPTRIAAVQAAIAAEPQPARVPRERPAPVAIHEGPLVLVETKKDLRNMTLPFEEAPTA